LSSLLRLINSFSCNSIFVGLRLNSDSREVGIAGVNLLIDLCAERLLLTCS